MKLQRLLFACCAFLALSATMIAAEQKSIQELAILSPDSLSIPSYLSPHFGDTVIVRGRAGVSVLINGSGGDRRPIMLIGKGWLTYLSSADSNSNAKAGIALFQRDTMIRTSLFDRIRVGDLIECTAIVTTLPYEFDAFSQQRVSLPALELVATVPVKTIARNATLDAVPTLKISQFYKGTRGRNAQAAASLYAGRKVRFDSVIVSSTSPILMFSDGDGNEIPMSDQSGYFTTKNHFIEESQFSPYTIGQKLFKVEGFITTNFLAGGGGGGMGGESQLHTYAIAPAMQQDVIAGPKPAIISLIAQRPSKLFPSSKDQVQIVYDVLSGTNLVPFQNIALFVSVDEGKAYTKYPAQDDPSGSWLGVIPAQPAGTTVRYYISAIDDANNEYRLPVASDYFYKVVDTYPKISDVKIPDTVSGFRNMQGASVTIEGIVMCDSSDIFGDRFQNQARAIIQDGTLPYSGAAFYRQGNNSKAMSLKRGQKVRVSSRLQEFGGVVFFGNIDSLEILGNDTPYQPVKLSTANFTTNPNGIQGSDQWRDMLVEFPNIVIGTIEPSAPQSTGEFIIVDQALQQDMTQGIRVETDESKLKYTTRDSIVAVTNRVKPTVGEKVDFVRGIIGADFRSRRYKLVPRFDRDFSIVTSINEHSIEQSPVFAFPNPASEYMQVMFDAKNSEPIIIQISDMITGKIIHVLEQPGHIGIHRIQLHVGAYPSGLYSVSVKTGMQVHIIPLTIQH